MGLNTCGWAPNGQGCIRDRSPYYDRDLEKSYKHDVTIRNRTELAIGYKRRVSYITAMAYVSLRMSSYV